MNYKTISIWLCLLWLTGCNDFLEESSQDEVKPSTVEDLEQVLLGTAYLNDNNIYYITNIFTDDVQCKGFLSEEFREDFEKKRYKFTWDKNMFAESVEGYDANFWEIPYKGIWGCNIVLDYLDDVEGADWLRGRVRGEALVLRSWYYLMLVNFFGLPYNFGNPANNPAVPLKLNSSVKNELFIRNTVSEVYAQIEEDLLEGNRLLKQNGSPSSYFRMGDLAAKAILSRMYLYMEDWDKALLYADSVLIMKSALLNLNEITYPAPPHYHVNSVYSSLTPDEIIWVRKGTPEPLTLNPYTYPFPVSDELKNMLEVSSLNAIRNNFNDLRARLFLAWGMDLNATVSGDYNNVFYPLTFSRDDDYGYFQGIRTAELYLNRAEVYARKYLAEGNGAFRSACLSDLNELRRHRLKSAVYTPKEITDPQELLDFCLEERRKELCGETNHRWCDIRRYGMKITHVFFEYTTEKTTLNMTENNWALPIPERVLHANSKLVQNP